MNKSSGFLLKNWWWIAGLFVIGAWLFTLCWFGFDATVKFHESQSVTNSAESIQQSQNRMDAVDRMMTRRGTFGDMFGGFTSLVSALTLIGVLYSIQSQNTQRSEDARKYALEKRAWVALTFEGLSPILVDYPDSKFVLKIEMHNIGKSMAHDLELYICNETPVRKSDVRSYSPEIFDTSMLKNALGVNIGRAELRNGMLFPDEKFVKEIWVNAGNIEEASILFTQGLVSGYVKYKISHDDQWHRTPFIVAFNGISPELVDEKYEISDEKVRVWKGAIDLYPD